MIGRLIVNSNKFIYEIVVKNGQEQGPRRGRAGSAVALPHF